MKFRRAGGKWLLTISALMSLWLLPHWAWAQEPKIEDLGGGKYLLGKITIDRNARRFTLPGSVIKLDQPLEYLVVKREGMKAYEAVLDAETTATEFNLACILIGLDSDNAVLPRYHFDEREVVGDPVGILIEWTVGEETRRIRPEEIFLLDGKPVDSNEWVYTGSTMVPPGNIYLAEESGTLIGFIHDQDSIIEHKQGIGLGRFGEVAIDQTKLPPLGTEIRISVTNLKANGDQSKQETK